MSEPIVVSDDVRVPERALTVRAVRASGPGGQNVNKLATKIDLRVDLDAIEGLSDAARARLAGLARHRLDAVGRLVVTSQVTRNQARNLEDARDKVRALVRAAPGRGGRGAPARREEAPRRGEAPARPRRRRGLRRARASTRRRPLMMTLNHGFSGYVVGQVVLPVLRRHAPVPPAALGAAFFLGAMAPDVDIVTRWLGGRAAYFSDAWYAHRAASHSVLGTLLLGLAVAAVLSAGRATRGAGRASGAGPDGAGLPIGYPWLAGCAWAGGLLHIVGDLFTPFRPMPVLWPVPDRFGALSHIGWFSPYLLWLFVTTIALGWTAAWLLPRVTGGRRWGPVAVWALYALASYRWVQYLVVSRYESAQQWQAYQEALLPQIMVGPLSAAVRAAWAWLSS